MLKPDLVDAQAPIPRTASRRRIVQLLPFAPLAIKTALLAACAPTSTPTPVREITVSFKPAETPTAIPATPQPTNTARPRPTDTPQPPVFPTLGANHEPISDFDPVPQRFPTTIPRQITPAPTSAPLSVDSKYERNEPDNEAILRWAKSWGYQRDEKEGGNWSDSHPWPETIVADRYPLRYTPAEMKKLADLKRDESLTSIKGSQIQYFQSTESWRKLFERGGMLQWKYLPEGTSNNQQELFTLATNTQLGGITWEIWSTPSRMVVIGNFDRALKILSAMQRIITQYRYLEAEGGLEEAGIVQQRMLEKKFGSGEGLVDLYVRESEVVAATYIVFAGLLGTTPYTPIDVGHKDLALHYINKGYGLGWREFVRRNRVPKS